MNQPRRMPARVRAALHTELTAAAATTDPAVRWRHLERAHILSQPWPWPHTLAHWQMLRLAISRRDRREAVGQVIRLLVAAPGSITGRYPHGNTGRASLGLTQPLPMPEDLAAVLTG